MESPEFVVCVSRCLEAGLEVLLSAAALEALSVVIGSVLPPSGSQET